MANDPQNVLTADDYTYYQVGRRRVNDTFALSKAQNDYQGGIATRARDRGLSDLKRQYQLAQRKFPQTYAKRGLLNSGLYNRGQYDLQLQNTMQKKNIQGSFGDQMGGLYMAGLQLGATRDSALSDIDMQEQARRATAQAIGVHNGGY
jgi:hypothetical protein